MKIMKFSMAKSKVLHLGWGNPKSKYRLGMNGFRGALGRNTWGCLWIKKSTQCGKAPLQSRKPRTFWAALKQQDQQVEGR